IVKLPEGVELCRVFGLDPLGTLASGCLVMTLAPADAGIVIHALARDSIDCHYIGQVVPRAKGVMLIDGNAERPLPVFSQDEITRRGLAALPTLGPATVSVPGCTRAWAMLLERFGTRSLWELLRPATHYAEHGFPMTSMVSQAIAELAPANPDPEWHRIFKPNGRVPEIGEVFCQPDLARSLRDLAADGADLFYTGRVGEAIAARMEAEGFLTTQDLAAHTGEW